MKLHFIRACTLAYALLSATLYCSLMPPWEGFDELYHYGYVQHVATTRTFPVIGKSKLSRELWMSLDFVPVSHYIQPYLERPSTSFEEYFHLTDEQRSALRRGVDSIERGRREEPSPRANYEAMQAPLTYMLLAPVDALLASTPLMTRVFVLRLLLAALTIALLWTGTHRFARRLGLPAPMETACLFVAFSCQMLYAETCRIGNDALTAPWLLFFLVAVMDNLAFPALGRTASVAILMALGPLIKSSMLAFLPLAFLAPIALAVRGRLAFGKAAQQAALSAAIIGALAGPWYLRNVLLYHDLSGNVETTSGVGLKELVHAAVALPWRRSIAYTAHRALWTGNNSFTTFSGFTLDAVLALLVLGIALYCFRARRAWPESITILAIALYGVCLVIVTLAFFHSSRGGVFAPMQWYLQILLVPILALAFLGMTRQWSWGRWIAVLTVLLWAYVAAVSWTAKLMPFYAGFTQAHARPGQLIKWYLENGAQRNSILTSLCPLPAPVLYVLLTAVLGTLLMVAVGGVAVVAIDERGPSHISIGSQAAILEKREQHCDYTE